MTARARSIAVVGSTPFAWLLAGLLAADHSRDVVLVTDSVDAGRLWPLVSLSLCPVTRPQTWAVLAGHGQHTARRLARIGPGLTARTDLTILARTPAARVAQSHMRHMAAGFGHAVEPDGAAAIRVRDIWRFDAAAFAALAPQWLAASGVALADAAADLKIRKDGGSSIGDAGLDLVVLADDAAILAHLQTQEIAPFATRYDHLGIMTAPVPGPRLPAIADLDTMALLAQNENGQIVGMARDDDGKGLERIAHALPDSVAPRMAARTRPLRLLTHDAAPAFGTIRRGKLFVAAGLGGLDIVLAPLVAEAIADAASGPDLQWAAAHGLGLRQPRADVAEYAADRFGEPS